jgi:ATP-dependent Clp protease ATP-binding subunit ClpA
MFERYTEEARRAIFYARAEAVNSAAKFITPAHLLQGLMWDPHLPTCPLSAVKAHESELRTLLKAPARPANKVPAELSRDVGLDQDAKKVLAYAPQEAAVGNSYFIDADHLLRGILRFPNEASTALESIPLDLPTVRAASKVHRAKYPEKKTLYHRLFGSPLKAHRDLYIKLLATLAVMLLAGLLIRWLNY